MAIPELAIESEDDQKDPEPKEVPAKKKRNGAGGHPKSFIWEDHAIQGRKILEGHYEATSKH
ncbi:hypothetical protein RhiirC2_792116 [Rhizophagus irregularis]|uniref:Uncharacterized protein n=1 Tax=Rhizophagus irregularis TaxID=588596 RepID=A0A2N1MHZ4_9GLOM|nr:hypothetical protein RhiirC2_792116 [Rhizophagus irregularis]